jgi:type IV pilus biogenesis protein CpaD/CtpE
VGPRAFWWRLAAGGSLLALVGAVVVGVVLSSSGGSSAPDGAASRTATGAATVAADPDPAPAAPARAKSDPPVTISVADRAVGQPIAAGFLGFSIEFQAVRAYTGSDPAHINPVLVQLIRNLTPAQAPVLRIGGDSTDVSYAPAPGVKPPGYVGYRLTPSWMATTSALAKELGARMIMGLNLAANEPGLAAAEARDYIRAFGPHAIDALEIGNEPNVYGKITVYHTVFGVPVPARPKSFGYPAFRSQFNAIAAASPPLALAGPALAVGPTPGRGSWVRTMPDFLHGQPRLSTMTVHRYPLRNCYVPPRSPQYPTISHLLDSYATVALAKSLTRWIGIAHRQHRLLRLDELNSVACRGKAGVSDTFASALWVTDALFGLARAGVDGINMHTLPDSAYELFRFSRRAGGWQGTVQPVYYGLQLFAQAAPAGSRLLRLTRHGRDTGLSAWATRAPDRKLRVVVINKDQSHNRNVTIRLPAGSPATATVERMRAPSVHARSGVTLGGRSYGAATATGQLGALRVTSVHASSGRVTLSVPHASAALVTVGA